MPASRCGLTCQGEGVLDEAFIVMVFDNDAVKNLHGVAGYSEEFNVSIES